ncbi:MAG: hypothetical protein IH953_02835 [Chloroflexi bacterium]|nr:hypothetical protein [Chloroflexota bacterium]
MTSGDLTNAGGRYYEGTQKVAEAYRLVQEALRKFQDAKSLAFEKEIDATIHAKIFASEAAVSEIETFIASYLNGDLEDPKSVARLKAGIEAMLREAADEFDPEDWPEYLG